MRQVVAYKRLKITLRPKNGRGRLQEVVVYKRFQLLGFNWENFALYDGRSLMGGGRMREVVAHGGSTVVGVRIYYYFRGEAWFMFIRFAFFHPRYRLAGGFIVWRTFLNLSKMTYRLVFSGSRHFVFIILFL